MHFNWKTAAVLGAVGAAIVVPMMRKRNRNNPAGQNRSLIASGNDSYPQIDELPRTGRNARTSQLR